MSIPYKRVIILMGGIDEQTKNYKTNSKRIAW